MRISTNTLYDRGVTAMQGQQSKVLHTQQQISTGRRVLTPADDPIAASGALRVQQSMATNAQYRTNRDAAVAQLSLTDEALSRVVNVLQSVRETAVNAGNGALSATDRATLAQALTGQYDELMSIANTVDSDGNYLFAGFQTGVRPFSQSGGGVNFLGDEGVRRVQADATRQIETSLSGAAVFQRIRNGNGMFVTQPAAANTGTGVIAQGTVVNPAALTGRDYRLDFIVAGAVTTYNVVDVTLGTTVATAQPYTANGTITIAGMQTMVTGSPANGDQFTISPSVNQGLFATLSNLASQLRSANTGPAWTAQFTSALGLSLANVDQALDHIVVARSDVGSRLKEIDNLSGAGESLGIQYEQTLSQLQDVDYAKAITDLTRYQTTLEAAQRSFTRIAGKSLFDYL